LKALISDFAPKGVKDAFYLPYRKGECEMSFNFGLLKEIRRRDSIKRAHLASLLGISDPYLYMLERGLRQPSIGLMEKLSGIIGVPAAELMQEHPETPGEGEQEAAQCVVRNDALPLIEFKKKLDRARRDCANAEKRVMELEKENEHLILLLDLHMKFEDIICPPQRSFSKSEMKQIAALARETAGGGEITFNEMLVTLRLKRSELTNILSSEKRVYKCRYAEEEGKEVIASNPGEAAMQLRCFDCSDLESGLCPGYGDEQHPENIVLLILRLEANGIYNRKEQSRILEERYHARYSAHTIDDIMYRHRSGSHIPGGMLNMMPANRKKNSGDKADN
jgi:transcriptional regulator with XRE-family HTH domain